MSKKLLLGITIVLLVTNIATLLFWSLDKKIVLEVNGETKKFSSKKPVAIVDGKKVTYQEWVEDIKQQNGKKQLRTMIDQKVVEQLAKEKNIQVDEKVIDRELALLTTMEGIMSEDETEQKKASWRESVIHRYQLEALLTEGIQVPAKEVSKYYEDYYKQYDFKASRQFSHIVAETRETAEKIVQELEQGASFDLLAKEYSIDDDSRDDGGYLGFYVKGSSFIPDIYFEKAEKMEERTYSEPLKVNNGYAVVCLHRKLPAIHFTYDEMKPYIKNELALRKTEQTLTAEPLWEDLEIEWIYGSN